MRWLLAMESPTEFSKSLVYWKLVSLLISVLYLDTITFLTWIKAVLLELLSHCAVVRTTFDDVSCTGTLALIESQMALLFTGLVIPVFSKHSSGTKEPKSITYAFSDKDIRLTFIFCWPRFVLFLSLVRYFFVFLYLSYLSRYYLIILFLLLFKHWHRWQPCLVSCSGL